MQNELKGQDRLPEAVDELDPNEIARRRDSAIFRALNTPPTPTKNIRGKSRKPKENPPKSASSPGDQKAS